MRANSDRLPIKRKPVPSTAIDEDYNDSSSLHRRGRSSSQAYLSIEASSPEESLHISKHDTDAASQISRQSRQESEYELQPMATKPTIGEDTENVKLLQAPSLNDGEESPPNYEAAVDSGAWYMPRMLVNRTLRAMSATMVFYATLMALVCFTHLGPLRNVVTRGSTSVPFDLSGHGNTCNALEGESLVLHLLINIAATMVLGISNTYQQLVTSLKPKEIRWALSKFRDTRVGTNSPTNINRKQKGRRTAWALWTALITTSLPVHLLANSVIGPAVVYEAPKLLGITNSNDTARALFLESDFNGGLLDDTFGTGASDVCYEAFRTGNLGWGFTAFDESYMNFNHQYENAQPELGNQTRLPTSKFAVSITEECEPLNSTGTYEKVKTEWMVNNYFSSSSVNNSIATLKGNCYPAHNVTCMFWLDMGNTTPQRCRLQIRMQAAFILMSCLVFKAIYTVYVNIHSRNKKVDKCLFWGDIIASSTFEPGLRVKNECMVNAGER